MADKDIPQNDQGAPQKQYGDMQMDIYLRGLRGVVPRYPVDFADLVERASAAMPPDVLSYVQGGCGDELTQDRNAEAFRHWGIVPRMLVDCARRDHRIELFGNTLPNAAFMDDAGAAPAELMDTAREHNPPPFSDFIGMPCLEHRLSFLSSDRPLTDANWTLFPVKLRDKLTFNVKLIDNPARLSSKLGLKTLETDKPTTFNARLINNPVWLSSKLGLKTLSENSPWRTSFGFPLLTQQQD